MKTSIYGLYCPINKSIVYIGKANNPLRRFTDHLKDQRNITLDKMLWLDKLKTAKLKPELEKVTLKDYLKFDTGEIICEEKYIQIK